MRQIPQAAIDLVKSSENCVLKAYPDAVGVMTIGYGHKLKNENMTEITPSQAEDLLHKDLQVAATGVLRLTRAPLNDNQFAALIDFVFNLGSGAYQASTLRQVINRGDYRDAPTQFMRWTWAGGRKLPGLVLRRSKEANLFMS